MLHRLNHMKIVFDDDEFSIAEMKLMIDEVKKFFPDSIISEIRAKRKYDFIELVYRVYKKNFGNKIQNFGTLSGTFGNFKNTIYKNPPQYYFY